MNINQFNLFDSIMEYTDEDNDVDKRRNSLIMFFGKNPNFQGIRYIEIWRLLTNQFYISQQRDQIPHKDLERNRPPR